MAYTKQNFVDGTVLTANDLNTIEDGIVSIENQLSAKAATSHTHSYAGSSSAGGSATSAVKLDSSAGSATQPVYFSGGKPVATTYTLGASVPIGAKFTDTTYSNFVKSGSGAAAGLVPAPSTTAGTTKYLREDGTWAVPPDTNTTYTSLKNPNALTVKGNGTSSFTYDGSAAKTLNIKAGTNVSVSSDTSGNITISATDTNTDTKVTQTVTTTNASYPLLLAPSGQTATATTTSYFDSGVTLNPSTNTIAANISGSSASCTGNAATATKATQDASGNAITSTYATKTELSEGIQELVGNLINGEFSDGGQFQVCDAYRAERDSSNNVITSTYATKQDVTDVVNSLAGGDIIVDYANCAQCDENRNDIIDTYATKQSLSNLQRHLTDDQLTLAEGLLTVARAKQDANGNVITETYATKQDITELETSLEQGDITVDAANSATNASNAWNDSAGNKIVDTYATKTEIAKLNYTNIAYGNCSTAAGTAAKVIRVTGNTNWSLAAGSLITVLFIATNTASNPTFNVNGTGAKNVFYGTSRITTSNLSYAGYKNRPMNFMYDGTQYRFIGWGYDGNSDAKTTTSNLASTKLYLVGAKTQSTSGQTTYSNSSAYVGTDNCLYSGGAKVATESYVTSAIASAITTALNTGV